MEQTTIRRPLTGLFFNKVAVIHVLKAFNKRLAEGQKAVLLYYGFGEIDEPLGDPSVVSAI